MSNAAARPPRLIVGLGNPGAEYSETRHNAGFWFCERLADQLGARYSFESRFHGLVANAREAGMWLLMPQTFMNRSGQAIGALARFYRIEPAEILVVHDELDLPAGAVKLKLGGGVAGHNGLKDVRAHLATAEFWRLRLGIGHPRDSDTPQQPVVDFVLKPPRADELDGLRGAIDRALDAWPAIASGDFERAMMQLHTKENP